MINADDSNMDVIIVPVHDVVLLPGTECILKLNNFNDEKVKILTNNIKAKIALPLKQNFSENELTKEDFHMIGVLFHVNYFEKTGKGYQVKVTVLERVKMNSVIIMDDYINGEYEIYPDVIDLSEKGQEDMIVYLKKMIHDISDNFKGSKPFLRNVDEMKDLNKLMGHLAQIMPISPEEKYEMLEIRSLKEKSLKFLDFLLRQKESLKLQFEIAEKFSEKANKNYRESVLREQLKAIQNELKVGKGEYNKEKDYYNKIQESKMPDEVKDIANYELSKFEGLSPSSPDYNIIRNYLDLLVSLPWKSGEFKSVNLEEARAILDQQHYGLEKVKDRIIQHLAVMELKKKKKGSILLLVGPPGTGKTSLGKSIAEVLGRKYIRLSLGGIRDEAEIRGHRRTYIGAMPGRIIQGIKKAEEKNPVMVLDEVDKLMAGHTGDPASALLEVLDPEQNSTFTDHYLDIPYDLSDVFFIATANSVDTIPRPLLDRMEVIQISSYTINEKFHIGKKYLLPDILEEHGLTGEQLLIEDSALKKIINDYTMEAGVRGLKKQLSTVARIASEKIVSKKIELPYNVTEELLEELLGRQVSRHDKAQQKNPAGVVTGLAWTPVGGEILFIEATDMPGNGQVILTGKLGEVMQESAKISLSLLKSRLAVNEINFKEKDLHIHVPSGAVPKDGPSAGIALFTALASLVTKIPVDSKLAMTGEITLRGAVLPIGGLKEKLIGAQRAGIKKVLIPKDNIIDLKDIPEEVKGELTIISVETIEDVLNQTLGISLPIIENILNANVFSQNE